MSKGANPDERSRYKLLTPDQYTYVNQSGCTDIEDISDEEQFLNTKAAMKTVGISEEEQGHIFSLLSAILSAGNIQFESPNGSNDSNSSQQQTTIVSNKEALQLTASLLGMKDTSLLEKYLCTKHIVAGNEAYDVPLTIEQAIATR